MDGFFHYCQKQYDLLRQFFRTFSQSSKTTAPDHKSPPSPSKQTPVGWIIDTPQASFIWDAPRPLTKTQQNARSAKAVQRCPSVLDLEARLFEVTCPFDLTLGIRQNSEQKYQVVNLAGEMSGVIPQKLGSIIHLTPETRWRHPHRPVLQINAPYRFIADEPVFMEQIPPYFHYPLVPRPGVMIGGRFPIHIWPRTLTWAFEWYDVKAPLQLKRGEPWFYVRFDTDTPQNRIYLAEAQMTALLREYCQGLDGVVNYVNGTYGLFKTAAERRPQQLLHFKTDTKPS